MPQASATMKAARKPATIPSTETSSTSLEASKLEKEREEVYQRLLTEYSDIEINDTKLGDVAEKRLFRMRHLSVGKVAPDIQGEDIAGKPMKLSDYRGKVVMLTFWGHW